MLCYVGLCDGCVNTGAGACGHARMWMYVSMRVLCVCVYVRVCPHMRMCIYICVCMCMCIDVYGVLCRVVLYCVMICCGVL